MAQRIIVERADGKWGWQLVVNGNIVATDGNQGYENEVFCRRMAERILGGEFASAEEKIRRRTP
ncbi:hypothetical protein A4U64_27330 (plasmid) [Rhodococcus sp. WB1]|uniref:DUF1508 domain-containing protein n=1 Tax=Rhodococcus ruber BKS 20-38 TaxID=1278076 RepID=M2ZTH3_9NOCA|nr:MULTISPECIES: hypothetical protein [Rhodococcus]ANZ28588.1 hypothetical protein A4U64_27330 [Rhodococcus sp. WB1]EME64073.1 hypothetical protein G352_13677 [Rhodococcus ruber BKS 20-38]